MKGVVEENKPFAIVASPHSQVALCIRDRYQSVNRGGIFSFMLGYACRQLKTKIKIYAGTSFPAVSSNESDGRAASAPSAMPGINGRRHRRAAAPRCPLSRIRP
ncbi:MAG: hypothetical protein WCZ72_07945, partial [Gemmobacter sp.]